MEKVWEIKEKKFTDLIAQLLHNRGVATDKLSEEKFLNPDFDQDFHDPKLLPDFDDAIKRIKRAIDGKEKIGIFADYDADGIPGAALLYKTFQLFGIAPEVYIPTRQMGYGFNQSGIDYLIEKKCLLIISVDLGIKEFELAKYIAKKNIDLIITDHHLPEKKLPKALAAVNPKIAGCKYPFKELAGTGVIYKIIQGLGKIYPEKINEKFLKWNLDLVAISTISDVVPLLDENRLIAKFGLKVLAKSRNLGVRAICQKAALDQTKINAHTVGFQLGPRINAPGRIDHATASFEILITNDKNQAQSLANHLETQNLKRQESMEEMFKTACRIIEKNNLLQNKILILAQKGWSKGLIGPVASQLVEKYSRPVVLLSESEKILDGSCRSISGFNIVEALKNVERYLLGFGGHAGAAGLHLKKSNFSKFSLGLTKFANKMISNEDLLPKINIDLELPKEKIGIRLFQDLEKLEPFGLGNPQPILITRNIRLISYRFVGRENKHLQLQFGDGIRKIKGVIFNHEIETEILKAGDFYDIVYSPGLNFWDGKWWLDLRVIDIKPRLDSELKLTANG